MKKLVSFSLITTSSTCCVNKIYKIPHLGNEVESSLDTSRCILNSFCCNAALENRF